VRAAKAIQLRFSVRSTDTGAAVTRFETVHEKRLHLFVVRDDLAEFFHEHPVPEPDGSFSLSFRFPTGGNWVLFADVAPQGAGSQIVSARLTVAGHQTTSKSLVPVERPVVRQNGLVMRMEPIVALARRTNWLVLTLLDSQGNAPSGLEYWLGAPAHLLLIREDAATLVHSHPAEDSPNFTFKGVFTLPTRFPKPGLYKAWLQVQHAGKLLTFPFVIRVQENALAFNLLRRLDRSPK
jgi:hypothetical protein